MDKGITEIIVQAVGTRTTVSVKTVSNGTSVLERFRTVSVISVSIGASKQVWNSENVNGGTMDKYRFGTVSEKNGE